MYTTVLQEPRPLERRDDRSRFQSGNPEIDDWFHRFAWQNHATGNAHVFVATQGPETLGFYALATGAVERIRLSQSLSSRDDARTHALFSSLRASPSISARKDEASAQPCSQMPSCGPID